MADAGDVVEFRWDGRHIVGVLVTETRDHVYVSIRVPGRLFRVPVGDITRVVATKEEHAAERRNKTVIRTKLVWYLNTALLNGETWRIVVDHPTGTYPCTRLVLPPWARIAANAGHITTSFNTGGVKKELRANAQKIVDYAIDHDLWPYKEEA